MAHTPKAPMRESLNIVSISSLLFPEPKPLTGEGASEIVSRPRGCH